MPSLKSVVPEEEKWSRSTASLGAPKAQFSMFFPDDRYLYCISLYGCQLWDFSKKEFENFLTAWRKAIRYVWRTPYRTHNNLLPLICGDLPVEGQLHKRFVKFVHKIINSKNTLVNTCGLLALEGSQSSACNSLNVISRKYSFDKFKLKSGDLLYFVTAIHNAFSTDDQSDFQPVSGFIK